MQGETMRDIRSDLEERAKLIEDDITRTVAQFEKVVRRLQSECDERVAPLKAELAALGLLIAAEHQRMPSADPRPIQPDHSHISDGHRPTQSEQQRMPNGPLPKSERHRTPNGPRTMAPPRQSLSNFLARKLAETGPRSKDDLSSFAVQEGYFPDIEHASRSVQAILVELLSGHRISALKDGRLAPDCRKSLNDRASSRISVRGVGFGRRSLLRL
jgi:hypothetical protein